MSEFISPNIQINIRCRPLTTSEIKNEEKLKVFIHDERNLSILLDEQEKIFHFDKVYGPDSSQEEIFSSVRPLLHGVLSGEKVTVFHYGQTTAGKTYAVSGTEENPGLIPRSIHELFDLFQKNQQKENSHAYQVSCQLFALNQVQLIDVLPGSEILRHEKVYQFPENNKVTVRQNKDYQLEIKNSSEIVVASAAEMLDIYRSGLNWLQWYTCQMGRLLSQETVIFLIRVKLPQCEVEAEQDERKEGKLFFVDLPGSERGMTNRSPADGAFRGKTLGTLGEVLAGINRGNRFIPYRDSKLTFLCSDSLTRTSKSVLFIHIKMSEKDISETINSLRFGRSISQDLDQQPVKGVAETISKNNQVLSDETAIAHPSK